VGGFLELRDTVGVSAGDPAAHGSGFDRVSAFQDGFDRGPERCMGYEEDPPEVVALPFRTTDVATGGNLPINQLVEPLLADLESFYRELLADEGASWEPLEGISPIDPAVDEVTCGQQTLSGSDLELASFYCVPDNTIYLDNAELVPALDGIGDFAVGGEIARQYAFAAQHQLGILNRHDATGLHADCLTGLYASAQFLETIPSQRLFLSAGDLDEIIIAFLAFGSDVDASAFERTAAFRTGFVNNFEDCEQFLQ
jgi:predicted metalloprotease